MDSSFYNIDKFKTDDIRAVDAKFEAQKIAFSALTFQCIRAMLNLNILQTIENAGDKGITRKDLAEKTGISERESILIIFVPTSSHCRENPTISKLLRGLFDSREKRGIFFFLRISSRSTSGAKALSHLASFFSLTR